LCIRVGAEPELIKGTNGVFDVVADGELIFSKHRVGRFPEDDEILELLRK
jgi:selT/selW/selH-like putative selenoprotein